MTEGARSGGGSSAGPPGEEPGRRSTAAAGSALPAVGFDLWAAGGLRELVPGCPLRQAPSCAGLHAA